MPILTTAAAIIATALNLMRRHTGKLPRALLGIVLLGANAVTALAGDDADAHDETGPRLFGFVRDNNGRPIDNARVSAAIKGGATVVGRTNATGAYRVPLPVPENQVNPANITVSCSKEGFTQLRVLNRTPPGKKPLNVAEFECRMQAAKPR